jgi:hypothetical protein
MTYFENEYDGVLFHELADSITTWIGSVGVVAAYLGNFRKLEDPLVDLTYDSALQDKCLCIESYCQS